MTPVFGLPEGRTDTSRAAAHSMEAHLGRTESMVLERVAYPTKPVGHTAHEVFEATRMTMQSVTARLRGLVLNGLVTATTTRRLTPSGRAAIVWAATQRGRDALRARL